MKAYMYDPEQEYKFKEEVECQRDPKESDRVGKDVWLLPANATYEQPPSAESGYVILFRDGHWAKLKDLRGKEYWIVADGYYGTPQKMEDYGDLPEGCSFDRPPMTAEEQEQADAQAAIEAEQKKMEQAKAERADAVSRLTVTVNNMVFDADETSQNRMSRVVAGAQALGIDQNTTQVWVLADNTVATPTVAQLAQALKLAGEAQTALWTVPYQTDTDTTETETNTDGE